MQQRDHHVDLPQVGGTEFSAGAVAVDAQQARAVGVRGCEDGTGHPCGCVGDLGQLGAVQLPRGRVVVDDEPTPAAGDAHREHVVAGTVHGGQHTGRRDAGDAVLAGAAAEQDGDARASREGHGHDPRG